jgi:hypothetical protein
MKPPVNDVTEEALRIITLLVQELWNECPDFILFHEISTVEKRHVEKMWFVDGGRKIISYICQISNSAAIIILANHKRTISLLNKSLSFRFSGYGVIIEWKNMSCHTWEYNRSSLEQQDTHFTNFYDTHV